MKLAKIFFSFILFLTLEQISAQIPDSLKSKYLPEEELAKKPLYVEMQRAFRNYDKVFRLAVKGTGGYYGKATAIDPRIDSLVYLQYFDAANQAIDYLPMKFGKLVLMQQVYLSGNKFKAIPDTLFNLKNLKRLDFSGNQLIKIPPRIGELTELEFLYLHDNKMLKDIPMDAFAKLKKLKFLNIRHTQIPRAKALELQKLLPGAKIEFF
jgi:hypothetical protein